MSRQPVITVGDLPALVLSTETLACIGASVGDELDVSVLDRALIVRTHEEAERQRTIAAITEDLMARRKDAYERLAQGA